MTKRNLTKGRSIKSRPLLLNSERKYKYLCEDGSAVMLMLGRDGKIIDANNALLEMSGASRDEILGKNVLDFVVPEHRKKAAAQIQAALIDGAASEFEVAFRSKDGSTRTLLLPPKQLALDEEGQRSFLVMGVDITERAKYETRLLALHTHASQLSSAEEIDTIVKYTLDALEFTLGFEHAYFLLVENDSLQIKGSRGRPVAFSAQPLEGRGTTVKAANTKTTLRISDTRKEPAFVDPKGYDWTGPPTVLSELVVPVLIDAEAVAVLCVDSVRLDAFSDEDQKLLETLAIHVGSALGRMRSVEALRVSEERFRQAMEATNDGLWDWNVETGTIYYSPAYYQMLGYESDEFPGLAQSWMDLIHPDERDGVLRSNQDCIENRIPNFKIEFRMRTKSGGWKWILGRGRASARDANGRALRMIGTHQDITERKRAEENLRESEERYRSLFNQMLDGVYRSTHGGRFVDVNSAFVKMFRYSSKQEVLDITDIKKQLYFSPEERGSHILDTGQEEVEVYRMRRKDGSEVWVEDHGRYVHGEQGHIIYHEGILRDVTERKRLQEELRQHSLHLEELVAERTRDLRESEEKYRELFEACPVSLWEEDFSVVKQFLDELRQKGVSDFGAYFANHPTDIAKCAALVKILNVNEATLDLYNAKSKVEIIGGLSGVLTEESNRAFVGELVALAQGKKYYEGELENRTLGGETKQCNVICAVVPGYEQSLAKVLICIVDLTPQKKLEAQLVKSQRLAAIGETAAMVGHDLRNPLQGIAGATYNIRRNLRNAPDPSTKEMLAVIDNGVQHANGIINDLLEFSREMQLQLVPTTPKSIVRQTLTDVKIPNNITVEDTTADAPEILADEPKIKRVLTNLIQNAIDAMPEGGKLSISSMNTQQEVSISIRDTGVGIPQDMVEKIWTPLYTTKAKGIGLGLPICRRIIEAHGGTISIESTVGKGTTFTLKLPIQHVQTGGEPL